MKLSESQLAVSNIEILEPIHYSSYTLPEEIEITPQTPQIEEEPEESIQTIEPIFNEMEQDVNIRSLMATLCSKICNSSKAEGDYNSQINSLSNIIDQHISSRSFKKVIDETYKEKFLSFFLFQLVDNEVLKSTLLEQLFNKPGGSVDCSEIRKAGKIQWHLEKAEKFISRIVAADHKAVEVIRDSVAIKKLENKAVAAEMLFDEELLETAPISKKKSIKAAQTEKQAISKSVQKVLVSFFQQYKSSQVFKIS